MEQPNSKPGPEPVDGSEIPQASPEESQSLSIEELVKSLKENGWEVNPGEFSAIFVPVGRRKPGPDEEDEEDEEQD